MPKAAPAVPVPLANIASQSDQINAASTRTRPPTPSGQVGPHPVTIFDGRGAVRQNLGRVGVSPNPLIPTTKVPK